MDAQELCTETQTKSTVWTSPQVHPGLTWCRRAGGLDACKTWTLGADGSWLEGPAPKSSGPEMLAVAWHAATPTLGELHRQLEAASKHKDVHAVLAALRPELGDATRGVRRDGKTFAPETWTRVLCVDVDGAALDPGLDAEGLGREVLGRLGLDAGAGFVWQWTASAGFKPGVRGRLWALWSEAVAAAEVKQWLAILRGKPETGQGGRVPWVDPSTYHVPQRIYTAAPAILGGPDPCPVRLVLVDGPAVNVGPVRAWLVQRELRARLEAQARREHALRLQGRAGESGDATRRWLGQLCARLAVTPKGQRHNATVAAVGSAACAVGEGRLTYVEAVEALVEAVGGFDNPGHHEAQILDGLRRWAL